MFAIICAILPPNFNNHPNFSCDKDIIFFTHSLLIKNILSDFSVDVTLITKVSKSECKSGSVSKVFTISIIEN